MSQGPGKSLEFFRWQDYILVLSVPDQAADTSNFKHYATVQLPAFFMQYLHSTLQARRCHF